MRKSSDGWDWVGVPTGMPSQMAAMLNGVADAGDDDTPRLAAADMFQEYGFDDFATFIRRQCADLAKSDSHDGEIKLCSMQYWSVRGARVTAETLVRARPWDRPWWNGGNPNYRIACLQMASEAYMNRSATIYPRVIWFRGFLSSIRYISPRRLYEMVASGDHAWHPWSVPGPYSTAAAIRFMDELIGFKLDSFASFDQDTFAGPEDRATTHRYYFHVGRYHGRGWEPHYISPAELIPEPIARFMTGRLVRSNGLDGVHYACASDASHDLNRAARLFLREAGKQSRNRVIAAGGTH